MPGLITMPNKTVLVTGSSDGIGFEVVKIFLRNSYNVIAHYFRSPKKLNQIKSNSLHLIQEDFSAIDNLRFFALNCKKISSVDILINNSAFFHYDNNINETNNETIVKYVNVNLIAPFILCQEFSKNMSIKKYGKIVNVSSVSVKHGGSPSSALYTITKSALEQMTRTLSKSFAKYNININTVRVGVTDTAFHNKNPRKDMIERVKLIPLNRIANPCEIATIIYELTTEKFSFCTGGVYDITGGE